MKKIIKNFLGLILLLYSFIFIDSCKRQDDWLNVKRESRDVTPRNLDDYQAVLNNDNAMNKQFVTVGSVESDNLNLTSTAFLALPQREQDAFLWKRSIWDDQGGASLEWNNMFTVIENANIVLDGLQSINSNTAGYNNVKGQALFYRAIAYYTLAQLFCKPYDASSAGTDLGLPIRLSSDVNILYQRSSLQKTYDQILGDANAAAGLLDDQPALDYRRPYQYSCWGLLAKIYLVMNDYSNAGLYANKVLTNVSSLLDFNSSLVSATATYHFPANGLNNPEILFYAVSGNYTTVSISTTNKATVDSALYSSYDNNDLRKTYFYTNINGHGQYRGAYCGVAFYDFCGIATNEIYLIRAECFARQGNTASAMSDLNTLLMKRYKTGTFTALTAGTANMALAIILKERRKELPFTADIRWEDLRRLNKDPNFQTTITRTIGGTNYILAPNDPKYVLPIPTNEVQLSGLQQNP